MEYINDDTKGTTFEKCDVEFFLTLLFKNEFSKKRLIAEKEITTFWDEAQPNILELSR